MKKKIFMVLSAVAVLAMGVLVVACSKDSNALHPNEEIVVEEVAPAPTLQKTNSAAEWEAFNLEIEKLNEKYLAPEIKGKAMRVGRDSEELSLAQVWEIAEADAIGAGVGGLIFGAVGTLIGGATGGANGAITGGAAGTIAGGVTVGVAFSILKWKSLTCSGAMVSINPPTSIEGIESDTLIALIGEQHNIIVEDFINNPTDLTNISDAALLEDILARYERLCGSISDSVRTTIVTTGLNEVRNFSLEVEKANFDFKEATMDMNKNQIRDYTEEYLQIVDANLSNSDEKFLVATYAGVAYYSSSMWEVKIE